MCDIQNTMLRDSLRSGRERQSLFIQRYKEHLATSHQRPPLIHPFQAAPTTRPQQQEQLPVEGGPSSPPSASHEAMGQASGGLSDDSIVVSKNDPPGSRGRSRLVPPDPGEEGGGPRQQERQPSHQPGDDTAQRSRNSVNNLREPPHQPQPTSRQNYSSFSGGVVSDLGSSMQQQQQPGFDPGLSGLLGADSNLRQSIEVLDEFAQFTISAAMGSRENGVSEVLRSGKRMRAPRAGGQLLLGRRGGKEGVGRENGKVRKEEKREGRNVS